MVMTVEVGRFLREQFMIFIKLGLEDIINLLLHKWVVKKLGPLSLTKIFYQV